MFKFCFTVLAAFFWLIGYQANFTTHSISSSLGSNPSSIKTDIIVLETKDAELTCLAQNILGESLGESRKGKALVAETTLNRVDSSRYPDTICEVVKQRKWVKRKKRYVYQFSAFDPRDPNYTKIAVAFSGMNERYAKAVEEAYVVAAEVMVSKKRTLPKNVTHYHASTMKKYPFWADKKKRYIKKGNHIFYAGVL